MCKSLKPADVTGTVGLALSSVLCSKVGEKPGLKNGSCACLMLKFTHGMRIFQRHTHLMACAV